MNKIWYYLIIILTILNMWNMIEVHCLKKDISSLNRSRERDNRCYDMIQDMMWESIIRIEKQGG